MPAGVPPGWRNNRWRPQEQSFERHDGARLTVRYVAHANDRFTADVDGAGGDEPRKIDARIVEADGRALVVEAGGVRRRFHVARHGRDRLSVHGLGRVSELTVVPRFPERAAAAVAGGCAAPMTGRVVEVAVKEGDEVKAGDALVVLEAMKMEHRLLAQTGGVVREVRVQAGQMVDPDEVLVVVEAS